jgi:hypothetical protein
LHLRPHTGSTTAIDEALAAKLFSGLWQCVRETDFVGWFEEGRVAGAVLTQHSDVAGKDAAPVVAARVRKALNGIISSSTADRLRVRVYLMPNQVGGRTS